MIHRGKAYARAGLIGNPSDGYFGKTISIILRNYEASVSCYESPRLTILPTRDGRLDFDSIDGLVQDVARHGYYGGVRLIKAAIKRFGEYCHDEDIELRSRNCTLEYETDIPIRVGLAGSSGIVCAAIRALMVFYDVEIPKTLLPNLILSVELDELGIGAGLQDRVIQIYEGAVYMDFDRAKIELQGHGEYVPLDPSSLPPLFVAYHSHLAEGTEITHNDLRSRYDRGDQQVHLAMKQFASLAEQARDCIAAGRGGEIGPLMDANFDLRAQLVPISKGNWRLIEIGREHGAHVKFAGSGGAVIGTYDGDPQRLARIRQAYEAFGASVIEPQVGGG